MSSMMLVWRSAVAGVCLLALGLAACRTAPRLRLPGRAGESTSVSVCVRDVSGAPVKDAVVSAVPVGEKQEPDPGQPRASMALEGYAFSPAILAVRVGTGVTFANRDPIDHQIYSISAAKNVDVLARHGSSSREVVFDRPGVVVLGCAAHDRTIGHVCVLETPYFAVSGADGLARLTQLPPGAYDVRVWHARLRTGDAAAQQRVAARQHHTQLSFSIAVVPVHPGGAAPPPLAPAGPLDPGSPRRARSRAGSSCSS